MILFRSADSSSDSSTKVANCPACMAPVESFATRCAQCGAVLGTTRGWTVGEVQLAGYIYCLFGVIANGLILFIFVLAGAGAYANGGGSAAPLFAAAFIGATLSLALTYWLLRRKHFGTAFASIFLTVPIVVLIHAVLS